MALTAQQRTRYDRNILIPGFGVEGQQKLASARVLVIGAGGLGSPVLLYLAAAGVGHFGIADSDVVEETNLQRQVIHRQADVGESKTVSAAHAARELNPDAQITRLEKLEGQALAAAVADYDLVLDCTDNFAAKFGIADACAAASSARTSRCSESRLGSLQPRSSWRRCLWRFPILWSRWNPPSACSIPLPVWL